MNDKKNQRNSSIELLRIICMLFIIAQHVIIFGVKPEYDAAQCCGGGNYIISHALLGWYTTAVDVFVLISGWFGIKWHPRKLVSMWLMVFFWSITFLIIKTLTGGASTETIIQHLLPITSRSFWFISVYFILCIIAPSFNRLIECSTKQQLGRLVIALCGVTYLWATISYILNFQQIIPDYGGGIVNFITLYLTARWLRSYGKQEYKTWHLIVALITIQAITQAFELAYSHFLGFSFTSLESNNAITCFLSAVIILLIFTKLKFQSRIINILAINCLAVYVLHMNDVVWPFILKVFHISNLTGIGIVFGSIFIAIIVYILGISIEALRKLILNPINDQILTRIFPNT